MPDGTPEIFLEVLPSDQEYVYGVVPPETFRDMLPSLHPMQLSLLIYGVALTRCNPYFERQACRRSRHLPIRNLHLRYCLAKEMIFVLKKTIHIDRIG